MAAILRALDKRGAIRLQSDYRSGGRGHGKVEVETTLLTVYG